LGVVLVSLAAYHVLQGALALIDPGAFFDDVGRYGVENDHYVGDVGAFVLAYGIALGIAVRLPAWRVPVLGLGALWYGLHALNHAFDVGQARSDTRGLFDTIALALGAVILAYLASVCARSSPGEPAERGR
jgi:hypothetical protein